MNLVKNPRACCREFLLKDAFSVLGYVPTQIAGVVFEQASCERRFPNLSWDSDENHLALQIFFYLQCEIPFNQHRNILQAFLTSVKNTRE